MGGSVAEEVGLEKCLVLIIVIGVVFFGGMNYGRVVNDPPIWFPKVEEYGKQSTGETYLIFNVHGKTYYLEGMLLEYTNQSKVS